MFNLFRKRSAEKKELKENSSRLKTKETLEERKLKREAFKKERIFDEFEWHYIDEIQPLTYPTTRTFEVIADSKVIENDFFLMKDKPLVAFADITGNIGFADYINNNLQNITQTLKQKYWHFVHKAAGNDEVENLNLSYYFPFKSWDEQAMKALQHIAINDSVGNQILKFYEYKGTVKTGFICNKENKFVFIGKKEEESIEDFVQQFLSFMPIRLPDKLYCFPPEFYTGFDNETTEIINQVKNNLDKLKDNGQFFNIAPTLLKMIEEASIATPKISRMLIDREYRILLPDYQNREIKLSHLTKCLYFLFLKHPRGVYAVDFKIYEEELFEIYKKISNRVDLEKMRESVTALAKPGSSELRIHISRIKSAFSKEFSDFYASKYYVLGSDVRMILLDRELLTWEAEV